MRLIKIKRRIGPNARQNSYLLPSFITRHFENRPSLQKISANIGWLFLDNIFRMVVVLFVGVLVARYLGPERFGILSYAIAFVSLFSALAKLGLDGIVVRDIVKEPDKADEILGTAFALKLFGGILLVFFSVGAISLLRPSDHLSKWLVTIIAVGLFFQAFDVIDFWFQSLVQSKYVVFAKNTALILTSLFKIALIMIGANLIAFACATALYAPLTGLGLIFIYKMYSKRPIAWKAKTARAKQLFIDSWPLILQGFVIMAYMRIDQIMLGELANSYEVGIYSVAVRLTEVWYFIPITISTSLFPAIINSKKLGEQIYMDRIQKLYTLMIWMAISIGILVTLFSTPIVLLLFGEEYRESAIVLSLQTWMGCSVFFGVARSKWLINEGYLKRWIIYTNRWASTQYSLQYFTYT